MGPNRRRAVVVACLPSCARLHGPVKLATGLSVPSGEPGAVPDRAGSQARRRDLLEALVQVVLEPRWDLPGRTQLPHLRFDLRNDLGGHPATAVAEPDTGDEESPIRSGNATDPVAPPGFTTSKLAAGSRRA